MSEIFFNKRREFKFCISKQPCDTKVISFYYINTNKTPNHFTTTFFFLAAKAMICYMSVAIAKKILMRVKINMLLFLNESLPGLSLVVI